MTTAFAKTLTAAREAGFFSANIDDDCIVIYNMTPGGRREVHFELIFDNYSPSHKFIAAYQTFPATDAQKQLTGGYPGLRKAIAAVTA
jgi:hypothetical protein